MFPPATVKQNFMLKNLHSVAANVTKSGQVQAGEQHARSGATVRTSSTKPFTPERLAAFEEALHSLPGCIREEIADLAVKYRADRSALLKQYEKQAKRLDFLMNSQAVAPDAATFAAIGRRISVLCKAMRTNNRRLAAVDLAFTNGLSKTVARARRYRSTATA